MSDKTKFALSFSCFKNSNDFLLPMRFKTLLDVTLIYFSSHPATLIFPQLTMLILFSVPWIMLGMLCTSLFICKPLLGLLRYNSDVIIPEYPSLDPEGGLWLPVVMPCYHMSWGIMGKTSRLQGCPRSEGTSPSSGRSPQLGRSWNLISFFFF